VTAGVGNWIADEVLYQAKLDPQRKTHSLSQAEVETLFEQLKYVIQTGVEKRANSDEFPEHWLFHHRWDLRASKKKKIRDSNGEEIVFKTVGGRTTAMLKSVVQSKTSKPRKTKKDQAKPEIVEKEDNNRKRKRETSQAKTSKKRKPTLQAEEFPELSLSVRRSERLAKRKNSN
jgi:formamidopyrimidine-DNA glycosylase